MGWLLRNREGPTLLRYRGLAAWDATGRPLPAWWQAAGREVWLRVHDANARYPVTIDPVFENAKLSASDGAEDDRFGQSVAVSGDTVVVGGAVGAPGGSAYVFVQPAGGWAGALFENAQLVASDAAAGGDLLSDVAVSGDTLVAGASGSVERFMKPPGGGAGVVSETARLVNSDAEFGDFFGVSAAVSGDTVVVGAPLANIGNNTDQGSAYVFVSFEAETATTQFRCRASGCRVPVVCNRSPELGTRCRNRIRLFVPRSAGRLSDEVSARAPRRIRFASGVSNIPPGETDLRAPPAHAEGSGDRAVGQEEA